MVGREVEFIPGYPLFFTNRGQDKLYELLGVRTYNQFMQLFNNPEGLDNDQLAKMVCAGLVWNKKDITLEEVKALIENEFYIKLGKNYEDFNTVIVDALANSGLLDKKRVDAIRKLKNMTPEEIEAELIKKALEKNKEVKPGEDTGEA